MKQVYRKKPVEIQAYQFFKDVPCDDVEILDKPMVYKDFTFIGKIKTIEDTEDSYHYVREGDYIITGVQGEIYACKEDVFLATYDIVDDLLPHGNC